MIDFRKLTGLLSVAILMLLSSETVSGAMHDASSLEWKLWGFRPNVWRMNFNFETLGSTWGEVEGIPMKVPGSVQKALLDAGIVKDWNVGLNSRELEWIENREWLLTAVIPDEWIKKDSPAEKIYLDCRGLDYKGIILINGKEAGTFCNSFLPYRFDITPYLKESGNTLVIEFGCPPENLAQIGWTSKITEWKPRFNYGWDWIVRTVQTGVWDDVFIGSEDLSAPKIGDVQAVCEASSSKDLGSLSLRFDNRPSHKVRVSLISPEGRRVLEETVPAGIPIKKWNNLKVRRWWPNGAGLQPLYDLRLEMLGDDGAVLDGREMKVGFRSVEWLPCKGAAPEADPWICSVNGTPLFLQGVDWTPVKPNFADLAREDYTRLLTTYKELGVNTIRIWGGGFAEKEWLYEECDRLGIMIWQDFPLSSSGLDNYPPVEKQAVDEMREIVDHYIVRLRNHPALLIWCGGNELYEMGDTAPITVGHPMAAMMKERLDALDNTRRFVPGTPSGPTIGSSLEVFGKGVCYDVHGPWNLPYSGSDMSMESVEEFWDRCDALFMSEVGVPGSSPVEILEKYRGECQVLPATDSNPYWRSVNWWLQWEEYLAKGGNPDDLDGYVSWSQRRQSEGLAIALRKNKARFPSCGGFIIWMGHDCFPCPINTSIIDFEGNPKPAALVVSEIWKTAPNKL